MKMPCDNKVTCPGDALGLSNFSSEDPDRILHLGRSYGFNLPPPLNDDNIIIDGCTTFSSSPNSQQDADLCADRHQQECQLQSPVPDPCQVCDSAAVGSSNQPASFQIFGLAAGSVTAVAPSSPCCLATAPTGCCCTDTNTDPSPTPTPAPPSPDPPPDPNPPPPAPRLYGNDEQTCESACPNGFKYTSTVPAGTYVALSKAQANTIAYSAACKKAQETRICPDDSWGGDNPCLVFCKDEEAEYQLDATARNGGDLFFSVGQGQLPAGLEIDEDGLITGMPTTAGQSETVTIDVCDEDGNCATKSLCVMVMDIQETDPLPDGLYGSAYSKQLHGVGGDSPYTFAVINGSLPDGLSMSTAGLISGTPTWVRTFQFAVQITDHLGHVCQKPLSININGTASDAIDHVLCPSNSAISVPVNIPAGYASGDLSANKTYLDSQAEAAALAQAQAALAAAGCACYLTQYIATPQNTGLLYSNCLVSLQAGFFESGVWHVAASPMNNMSVNPGPLDLHERFHTAGYPNNANYDFDLIPFAMPKIPANVILKWHHTGH